MYRLLKEYGKEKFIIPVYIIFEKTMGG